VWSMGQLAGPSTSPWPRAELSSGALNCGAPPADMRLHDGPCRRAPARALADEQAPSGRGTAIPRPAEALGPARRAPRSGRDRRHDRGARADPPRACRAADAARPSCPDAAGLRPRGHRGDGRQGAGRSPGTVVHLQDPRAARQKVEGRGRRDTLLHRVFPGIWARLDSNQGPTDYEDAPACRPVSVGEEIPPVHAGIASSNPSAYRPLSASPVATLLPLRPSRMFGSGTSASSRWTYRRSVNPGSE
jgi:hypothetical protein